MPVPEGHIVTEREAIYDATISPLMKQIIHLCKVHDIPMLAAFDLDDNRGDTTSLGFKCMTALLPENANQSMHKANAALCAPPAVMVVTVRAD